MQVRLRDALCCLEGCASEIVRLCLESLQHGRVHEDTHVTVWNLVWIHLRLDVGSQKSLKAQIKL